MLQNKDNKMPAFNQQNTNMGILENILVIKLSALGDFIQALGPMAAIRKAHPDAKITLLTTKMFTSFAQECGYFDDIIIDNRPRWYDISGWVSLRTTLNGGQFDRVYDLQNNDRTSFYLSLFSQKPEWVGIAKGASHRNTDPSRIKGQAFEGHVQTLALAGIQNVQVDTLSWIQTDISRFNLKNPYVLIVPGCAPTHMQKRWPPEHYANLCQSLLTKGYHPVLLGTESEKDTTQIIAQSAPGVHDLTGQTSLFDIAVLGRHAAGAVGNDTGPMHIIAPTGCPSLILFSGHSNPVRHAPKGETVQTLQVQELDHLSPEKVTDSLKTLINLDESESP